jgi:hypothetical protein
MPSLSRSFSDEAQHAGFYGPEANPDPPDASRLHPADLLVEVRDLSLVRTLAFVKDSRVSMELFAPAREVFAHALDLVIAFRQLQVELNDEFSELRQLLAQSQLFFGGAGALFDLRLELGAGVLLALELPFELLARELLPVHLLYEVAQVRRGGENVGAVRLRERRIRAECHGVDLRIPFRFYDLPYDEPS